VLFVENSKQQADSHSARLTIARGKKLPSSLELNKSYRRYEKRTRTASSPSGSATCQILALINRQSYLQRGASTAAHPYRLLSSTVICILDHEEGSYCNGTDAIVRNIRLIINRVISPPHQEPETFRGFYGHYPQTKMLWGALSSRRTPAYVAMPYAATPEQEFQRLGVQLLMLAEKIESTALHTNEAAIEASL
jgi:hypothetical protein